MPKTQYHRATRTDLTMTFLLSRFERGLGIKISGVIATQEDAEDAIWFIQALQSELPMERNDQPTTPESQH